MLTRRKFAITSAGAAISAATAFGQASPLANVSVTIAGKKINIDYYSPRMRGRKVMGGLVPYGVVWCTGANWATTITADAELDFGPLKVPKGRHTIWTLPGEKEWLLIINNQTGQFHTDYNGSRDLGRTKMNLKTLPSPVENFRIELRPDSGNTGTLALIWEKTEASIPFTVVA